MKDAIVVHIDRLAHVCGYFNADTDANNHYGCNHPDCEEYEILHKDSNGYTHRKNKEPMVKQGKCYSWSCPFATECDLEDLKNYSPDDYEQWKDNDFDPVEAGAELVLVFDKELIQKLSI